MHMAFRYTGNYEVDAAGNGMLPCGTPISTYYVEDDNFPPLDLSHPNLLHIFFTNYAKKEVVCARRGVTLSEWLQGSVSSLNGYPLYAKEKEGQAVLKKKKKRIDETKEKEDQVAPEKEDQAAPEKEDDQAALVKEDQTAPKKGEDQTAPKKEEEAKVFSFSAEFRNCISGMIQALCYIHKKGYSIEELSEEHVCILDGEVRLWKLNFITTSIESQNQSFKSIANIISRVLEFPKNLACECPPDITNLLNVLRSDRAAMHQKTIPRHMAMIPPEMRLMLVDEMFQMGKCAETARNWEKAADVFFVEADLNHWDVKYKKKITGYLLDCYNFRSASIPYTVKLARRGIVKMLTVFSIF